MINLTNCKIAITGHTRGIGQSLKQILETNNADVTGYSLSTGYDIGDPVVVKKILQDADNFDIFINNAYHPVGQYDLLKGLITQWKGTNKLIVNISSTLVYYPVGFNQNKFFDEYIVAKQKQLELTRDVLRDPMHQQARVLNVIPGLIETDMSDLEINQGMIKAKPIDLAKVVVDVIKYMDVLTVKEIVIDTPRSVTEIRS